MAEPPSEPPAGGVVVALLGLTTLGTAAYWLTFFGAGKALHISETSAYLAFERSFPAADAWMAGTAAAAAVGLARRRAWAPLYGIAAGSALVFLGLMDVLFDLENGLYAAPSGATAAEVAINLFCLTMGPFFMTYFWRHRDRLRPPTPASPR